jgi:hypothetical protein
MIDTGKTVTWKAKVVYEVTPEWESTIYGRRRHSLAGRDQPCTWTRLSFMRGMTVMAMSSRARRLG